MLTNVYFPPLQNGLQKTLDANLLTGVTASATLNNVTGIQNKKGIMVIDRVDGNNNLTPNKREYISFNGTSGSTVVTLGRGLGGSTDQDHAVGAIVEFVNDIVQQQAIIDNLPASLVDAKGDLIVASAADTPARLAVGSDGYVPRANSGATNGIEWTPPYNSLAYQCIINGGFPVNQRGYVSNATLAAGAYGHDRWKAGASGGDYTFTQLPQSTQITIKSGKSLIQVVEDKNVIGGTYTLSWTGTAQARFGINSATPSGAYAASPITITTQTAGTVMSVEFNEGTLGQVNLANSSVALPFMPKSYDEELRACQRYCFVPDCTSASSPIAQGVAVSTTICPIRLRLPVTMRITPTIIATATDFVLADGANAAIDLTSIALFTSTKDTVEIDARVSSGLTQYRVYQLLSDGTAGRILVLSSEI